MSTRVYVDGLNLYYGALKGTRFKWLDLVKLAGPAPARRTTLLIGYVTLRRGCLE